MSALVVFCCSFLVVAHAGADDSAECGGRVSASRPINAAANYSDDNLALCDEKGQRFPANRLFHVYTRPFDWNPLGDVELTDLTKHQYYLVDQSTGQQYGSDHYLTNTKEDTPHFPPCIQDDGSEHPKFVTSCFGRCGAGCGESGKAWEEAAIQSIGVGYTSTDYFAGKDAEYDCHVGCWLHDLCVYAKLCPKSVQWVDDTGKPKDAPKAVLDQCNAKTNPSIFKCGALEYSPSRRKCNSENVNEAWPNKEEYKEDCIDSRVSASTAASLSWMIPLGIAMIPMACCSS